MHLDMAMRLMRCRHSGGLGSARVCNVSIRHTRTWLLCGSAAAGDPDPGATDGPSPGAAAALWGCVDAAPRPMAGSCCVPRFASGGGASRLRPAASWLVGDDPPGAALPLPPPEPTLAGPTASAASAAAAASWTACRPGTARFLNSWTTAVQSTPPANKEPSGTIARVMMEAIWCRLIGSLCGPGAGAESVRTDNTR